MRVLRSAPFFLSLTLGLAGLGCGSDSSSPEPDGGAPAGVDAGVSAHGLIVFGGYYTTIPQGQADPPTDYLGETWSWNGSAWTQEVTASGPGVRDLSMIALVEGTPMLFGGEGGDPDDDRTTLNDAWFWTGSAWTANDATGMPEEMTGATAVSCNGKFVLFGGYDFTGSNRYDTWTWDGTAWMEYPWAGPINDPSSSPRPTSSLGTAAASVNGTCYLIDVDGKMYTWSGSAWDLVDQGTVVPPARTSAVAAPLGNKMVLYGGFGSNGDGTFALLGDTWLWDGTSWTESTSAGPTPVRGGMMMAAYGSVVVLFGGAIQTGDDETSAPSFFGDTWTFDGTTWTQAATTGPSPRSFAVMIGY